MEATPPAELRLDSFDWLQSKKPELLSPREGGRDLDRYVIDELID